MDFTKRYNRDWLEQSIIQVAYWRYSCSIPDIYVQPVNFFWYLVPVECKLARVTPVFKKGARKDVNYYRPISIIPAVAKIFERIIYNQFYGYLNDNDLLANCQSGFISLHSTLTALLEATNSSGLLTQCDVRFLGCSSSLNLTRGAALRWVNRRIIDGAIPNQITKGRNGTKAW